MGVEPTQMKEKEMFYLTMHSTHFIYGYMASETHTHTRGRAAGYTQVYTISA